MDFLVTILIFAAISYFNAQKNKNAKERRRSQGNGRPEPAAKKATQESPQSPGDLMREIARQLGLEEVLEETKKAAGKRVPPPRKAPVQKQPAKEKSAGYGQPLQDGAAVPKAQPQVFHEPGSTRGQRKTRDKKPLLGPLPAKRISETQAVGTTLVKPKVMNHKNNNIQKQLGISNGAKQALRQGVLWSQVLSEPKFRKSPYFGQMARKN